MSRINPYWIDTSPSRVYLLGAGSPGIGCGSSSQRDSLASIELFTAAQVWPENLGVRADPGVNGGMPRIPDQMLDGVAFLYPTKEDAAHNRRVGGSAFVVGRRLPKTSKVLGQPVSIPYLVSCRHVVWEAAACVARFNRHDGKGKIIDLGVEHWHVHPAGDDLAAVNIFGLITRAEERFSCADFDSLITQKAVENAHIGVGDDVFMIGRFINHQGRENAIQQSVRFGNISMAPAMIRQSGPREFDQLSWAVEMRSRSGFSGSPVIAYRVPGAALADLPEGSDNLWGVLGVDWGHIVDEKGENTWLNGVVPSWKVIELLDQGPLREHFDFTDALLAKAEESGGVVLDVAVEDADASTTDMNPKG